jgi:hypothetical protein
VSDLDLHAPDVESAPACVVLSRRAQILARGRSLETTAAMLREAR